MFERRTHIRIPVGLHGRYQQADKMAGARLGLTQNVSMGGLQMACLERLEPGDPVAVDLPLPREGEVGLTGVVVWARKSEGTSGGFEVGMKWTALDPSAQARLSAYINSYNRARPEAVTVEHVCRRTSLVSWPRTIGLAVLLSGILLIALELWISAYEMSLENRALRSNLRSQELLQSRLTPASE